MNEENIRHCKSVYTLFEILCICWYSPALLPFIPLDCFSHTKSWKRTINSCWLNKRFSTKFQKYYWVEIQTPEEGRWIQLKHCEHNSQEQHAGPNSKEYNIIIQSIFIRFISLKRLWEKFYLKDLLFFSLYRNRVISKNVCWQL